jgi:hypothetical protein
VQAVAASPFSTTPAYHAIIFNSVLTSRLYRVRKSQIGLQNSRLYERIRIMLISRMDKVEFSALSSDSETFSDVTTFEVHSGNFGV